MRPNCLKWAPAALLLLLTLTPSSAEAVIVEGTTRVHDKGRTLLVPGVVQVIDDRTGQVLRTTTANQLIWLGTWTQGYFTNAPDLLCRKARFIRGS